METNTEGRVQAIRITDNKTGLVYTLDFNRDSVRFAEARGFEVDSLGKFPATKIPELFYYAFRMHHKNVARSQTDALLDAMGGLTGAALERLGQLYSQAALSNVISTDEEAEKNDRVTVEL